MKGSRITKSNSEKPSNPYEAPGCHARRTPGSRRVGDGSPASSERRRVHPDLGFCRCRIDCLHQTPIQAQPVAMAAGAEE